MKLTWYKHACFKLETSEGSVVFDPYQNGYLPGIKLPQLSADLCLSSHRHGDHYAPGAVQLSGRKPAFTVTQISCFHDEVQGKKRGENMISIIEAEGLRVCHMGDIGHQLDDKQLEFMGRIDVLLLPVGGVYTVDARGAKALADSIKPRVIVPMHYKMGSAGLQNVAGVDDFLALYPDSMIKKLPSDEWEVSLPDTQTVLVFA